MTDTSAWTMTGREFLQSAIEGRNAPAIGRTLGFELTRVEDGEVWFECTPDGSVYNPIGAVHGGLVCTLLDSACGCAVHSTLPAGTGYTSVEIKVSYLRPVQAGDELVAHGWVTKPGRRVAFAEGDVRDAEGRIVATGSSTLLIMSG
jgi:uncharacterized protein (TIGR00369 family)